MDEDLLVVDLDAPYIYLTTITNDAWVTKLFSSERKMNDHNHNQRSASSSAAMVRQRASVTPDAKVDSQADGAKERAATK